MNKMYVCILLIMISTLAFAELYVPGHVIFKAKYPITILQTEPQLLTDKAWFNSKIATYSISELHPIGADKIPSAYLSERLYYYAVFDTVFSVKQVVNSMKGENEIVFAEPNYIFHELSGVDTNDPKAVSMWGLKNIGMQRVWDELQVYGDPSVVVSVIDSGIDLGNAPYPYNTVNIHPDLLGNVWQAPGGNYGWNWYTLYPPDPLSPPWPELIDYPHDKHGHGTTVSGVISAINNNEYAVSSVAGGWNGITAGTKIMPIRVGNPNGSYLALWYGLITSYQYGVRIINLSMGARESQISSEGWTGMRMIHELIIDMYNDAYGFGVRPLIIAAGGNYDGEEKYYPACFPEVLAVGAVDVFDMRGRWNGGVSTIHSTIDIMAPGSLSKNTSIGEQIGIYTTFPTDVAQANNYGYTAVVDHKSGSSLAAPHVSGVASLLLSQYPNLTLEQLRGRLVGTSDYIYDKNQEYLGLMGSGRLNAYRALTEQEQPNLVLNGIQVDNVPTDNLEIGQPIDVRLSLKNWWANASNVWGLLSTNDHEVSIDYCGSDRITWGSIPTETSEFNTSNFTIRAWGYNRAVTFTLTVDSDANNPKVMCFTLNLQIPLSESHFCEIPPGEGGLEGGKLNKNFTVKDINNDGFDEIFVTSDSGYLFVIHQDGRFARLDVGPTTCTPAVGDVDSDKILDIVVGNRFGVVKVFSGVYPYAELHNISVIVPTGKVYITHITLEDMNNDGQLDIIATCEKTNMGEGYNGFSIINLCDLSVHNYDSGYTIQHGVSVDDVNGNGWKEVVFMCQNYNGIVHNVTNLYLDMVQVSEGFIMNPIYHNTIGTNNHNAGSTPMIADMDCDGAKEVLIRYEWDNHGPDSQRARKYGIQAYQYHETNLMPIWQYPTIGQVYAIGQNDNILIGDFCEDAGLEMLFTQNKAMIIGSDGDLINVNAEIPFEPALYQEYLLSYDNPDNDTKYFRLAGSNQSYKLTAFNSNLLEDYSWRYEFDSNNLLYPIGMALVRASYGSTGLVIPYNDGRIMLIPVKYGDSRLMSYTKYRYNSRHTGSYNQPLPEAVNTSTVVKHNLYLESNTRIESDLKLEPGINVVIDPNVTLRVYDNLRAKGNVGQQISIRGTCLSDVSDYWGGILFRNGSSSNLKYCSIKNAATGVTYQDTGLHTLELSSLSNNIWGVGVYQANPTLTENLIYNNTEMGMALHNGASPYMRESSLQAGRNAICDNPVGIFSSQSNPLLKDGHNDIDNHDFNIQLAFTDDAISAENNWWGSSSERDIVVKFNEPNLVLYNPWDTSNNTNYTPQQTTLSIAMGLMFDELYQQAIPYFHQVLADSTVNYDDHASINALLTCYDKTNNLNYYRDFILCQLENELHEKLELWYKDCLALINRSVGRFMEAISYYEYKLDNSTTLADSCYAIIDLGNTYLESNSKTSGKYAHLVPKSYLEHSQLTKELLNKIYSNSAQPESSPPIENVVLKQNYPNPFNPTTTISFYLPQQTKAQLLVYNLKGQVVNKLRNDVLDKGYHSVVWDGKDHNGRAVASGIYFYQLKTDKSIQIKKCILLK